MKFIPYTAIHLMAICFDVCQAWEAAAKVVKDEEAIKQKLCEDLNSLVHIPVKCSLEFNLKKCH